MVASLGLEGTGSRTREAGLDGDDGIEQSAKRARGEGTTITPRPSTTSTAQLRMELDDEGCCCKNVGCPWQWHDVESTRTSGGSDTRSTASGVSANAGAGEPSFFHGRLLSVKEFRDAATGDIKLVVFQGGRRASVAQIILMLNLSGGKEYGHVKCVTVEKNFRGMGFGPLLFKEVFATLGSLSVPEVRLEAEEDMEKYNRLVRYYESLGFRQREGSKVHYLYSNDQTFRKVPMHRPLNPILPPRARRSPRLAGNSFLLVRLQAKTGGFVRSTADGNVSAAAAAAAAARAAASGTDSSRSDVGSGGFSADSSGGDSSRCPGGGTAMGCGADGGGGGGGGGVAGFVCGGQGEAPGVSGGGGGGAAGGGGVADGVKGRGHGGEGKRDGDEVCADHWILMQEVRGIVCFESAAYGKYLCVEPDGKVVADRSWDNSWEQFRVERFPDPGTEGRNVPARGDGSNSSGGGEASLFGAGGGGGTSCGNSRSDPVPGALRAKDRFALRTHHGQYLSLDEERGTVSASAQPVLWTTDETNAICHCEGTATWAAPPRASRRQIALQAHLRRMRQQQSVSFVTSLREKYLASFGSRGRLSIKDALFRLQNCRDPLAPAGMKVSLAGLMVLTAEDIRDEGLPDWMQAVGLVHGLGKILHFLGEEAGSTPIERECVLGEYSWVVGAPFPESIACPSYNSYNVDAADDRYGGRNGRPTGMYQPGSGLGNALLCFTGPEYMHMVLRHNRINIPEEGLAMLRLYPLEPWHAREGYSALESPADRYLRESVRQFDAIRRLTVTSVTFREREVDLTQSWNDHLSDLVNKFFPGVLEW